MRSKACWIILAVCAAGFFGSCRSPAEPSQDPGAPGSASGATTASGGADVDPSTGEMDLATFLHRVVDLDRLPVLEEGVDGIEHAPLVTGGHQVRSIGLDPSAVRAEGSIVDRDAEAFQGLALADDDAEGCPGLPFGDDRRGTAGDPLEKRLKIAAGRRPSRIPPKTPVSTDSNPRTRVVGRPSWRAPAPSVAARTT